MKLVQHPNSKFLKVQCTECEHTTIVFNHAKTSVICSNDDCKTILAQPQGGKAIINGEILEELSYE